MFPFQENGNARFVRSQNGQAGSSGATGSRTPDDNALLRQLLTVLQVSQVPGQSQHWQVGFGLCSCSVGYCKRSSRRCWCEACPVDGSLSHRV